MSMRRREALKLGLATGVAGMVGAVPGTASAEVAGPSGGGGGDLSDEALVRSLPGFRNGYARVNGVRLHYVIGGRGAPLVLLPGWPETWWQFHKLMPALANRYQVIAVDLRGMGGSGKPPAGFDKKTMASDVYELVRHLGHDQIQVAGHDVGSMVAFSFAANHPEAVTRVAMLDVAHPDDWLYSFTLIPRPGQEPYFLWWMAFNQVKGLPEQLLTGRSRFLIDWKFAMPGALANPAAVSDHDKAVYANAYNYPDAIRASNGWYQALIQDIADAATYPVVRTPILAMHADVNVEGPPEMLASLANRAADVRALEIKDAGHYFPEEQPEAVVRGLTEFFG
jgi:pimeloyl-ACP methyl ester carboxylesterase